MENFFKNKKGLTLMEILVAAFITVIVFGSLLTLINYTADLQEMSRNRITAMNAARQMMEQVKLDVKQAVSFSAVVGNYDVLTGIGYNLRSFTPIGFAAGSASGIVYTDVVPNSTSNLYDVTVAVCWRQKNGRVIGEDQSLNGILDGGEDTNGNGRLDSPCVLTSAVRDTKGL